MGEVAKKFNIKKIRTTAFHPASNGSLERTHITLVHYIRQFIEKDSEWDNWIELAMFAYNTSVHESTQKTPYELVFGKMCILPSPENLPKYDELDTYDEYLIGLMARLDNIRSEARENLINAKEKYKRYYDKNVNPISFSANENVFLRKGIRPGKFCNYTDGPYKITEVLDDKRTKIRIKNKDKIVSTDRLIATKI